MEKTKQYTKPKTRLSHREAIRLYLPRLLKGELNKVEYELMIDAATYNAPYWVRD